MSEPEWHAVLVSGDSCKIWPMIGSEPVAVAQTVPKHAVTSVPGPAVVAGLTTASVPVPSKLEMDTAHVPGAPQIAAIPMLRQDSPPALSRGAETAIAGFLANEPDYDGVLLVLGEEACWAHISAEEVVSFQGFMTPALMRGLGAAVPETGTAFDAALGETLARPDKLALHLAGAKVAGTGQEGAHLIGAELASAKPYWLGQKVTILAEAHAAEPYLRALEIQGVVASYSEITRAYLGGLHAAWVRLQTQTG